MRVQVGRSPMHCARASRPGCRAWKHVTIQMQRTAICPEIAAHMVKAQDVPGHSQAVLAGPTTAACQVVPLRAKTHITFSGGGNVGGALSQRALDTTPARVLPYVPFRSLLSPSITDQHYYQFPLNTHPSNAFVLLFIIPARGHSLPSFRLV